MLVYHWIFIDYYGECETADVSMYLEWSDRYLHISMFCSALHRREGWSQQSSLAFKATSTKQWLDENRADFDRVKRCFFYTTIEKI